LKFQTVGWEYILISVPSDWNMVFEKEKSKSNKEKTGYFGFSDSKGKRLEFSYANMRDKPPKLPDVLESYFKSLKKNYRKIKIRKEATSKVNEHDARYLFWELEKEKMQGYITAWTCPETNRLMICTNQFSMKNKTAEKAIVLEILSHINCHPESTYTSWSSPNLQIYTPFLKMNLMRRQFLIGLTFLEFNGDEMRILGYRVGLANQKIKSEEEIPEWFKSYYREHFPRVDSKFKPETFNKMLFKNKISVWKNTEIRLSRIPSKNYHFESYLWTNPDKNDIYCLIFELNKTVSKKTEKTIEDIVKLTIGAN
jgi:hypothetical protein